MLRPGMYSDTEHRPERHADGGQQGGRTDYQAHGALAEVLARQRRRRVPG